MPDEGGADEAAADEGRALALGVVLIALAGYVDAVAFVRFSGLFVSFVSGNSTRLAALPAQGRLGEALESLGAVALFVMGAFAGRLISLSAGAGKRPLLLLLVAALLALATVSLPPQATGSALALGLAAMALAMGLQNSVLHHAGEVKVTTTYVTGALVSLGHALADAVAGRPSSWLPYLLMWLGLVGGAAVGAFGAVRIGALALAPAAAAAALLALGAGALVRPGQGGRTSS